MAQIVDGWRRIFSHPIVYQLSQKIIGGSEGRMPFIHDVIKPMPGMKILDIGCGPGDILDYLPHISYWGFDINYDYIEKAKTKYGNRGVFTHKVLEEDDLKELPCFDIVIGSGLLHHLDDDEAMGVMGLASGALRDNGRFVTIDPVFEAGQSPLARLLISMDRGQNVRTSEGYKHIAEKVFTDIDVSIRHKAWVPYTHCLMTCYKSG